jgi:uncharacterized protein (TIGR02217 family)
MSDVVYPSLPGLGFTFVRAPVWKTLIQTTASGRELRAQLMSYPIYKYTLTYELLRSNASFTELQTLIGFFNARGGSFDSFLFSDPDDNAVTAQFIANGDGVTRSFQLIKTYGGYVEPVYSVNLITQMTVNGVATSAYAVNSDTGQIIFTTAPPAGQPIAWTGSYYYRCRFLADTYEFEKFQYQLWDAKKIEFQTIKP